jgi:acetylornithine/N-succinyldiaminopimelate aminotransferase
LIARDDICLFEPGDQGGTYNGNPLMTAVGYAVVNEVGRTEFLSSVRENGEYLVSRLRDLSTKYGLGEVRGRGLLLALELGREIGTAVVNAALSHRLLINSPRPAALRFMPALNVSRSEIDQMLRILDGIIDSTVNLKS